MGSANEMVPKRGKSPLQSREGTRGKGGISTSRSPFSHPGKVTFLVTVEVSL